MSGGAGRLVAFAPFAGVSEKELAAAGFDGVSLKDAMKAPATLPREVIAFVAPALSAAALLRRTALRNTPCVCVVRWWGWGVQLWPAFRFPRGAIGLRPADLEREGALAEAVQGAIRQSNRSPTSRARLGETLWYVGAALQTLFVAATLVSFAMRVSGRARANWESLPAFALMIGFVLMDIGGSMGLAMRPRLSVFGWVAAATLLAFAAAIPLLPR